MFRRYKTPEVRLLWVFLIILFLCLLPDLLTLPALENYGQDEIVIQNCINPNTADWPALARLPGIGRAKARAIVKYRNMTDKKYNNPEDLTAIYGIGPATVEKIAPYLVFSQP